MEQLWSEIYFLTALEAVGLWEGPAAVDSGGDLFSVQL